MDFRKREQNHLIRLGGGDGRSSRLSESDKKWDSMREDIRKCYILEGNTLPKTMELIQEKHGFQASPRKWKMKFKEWNYEKRLTESDMKIVTAKAERRAHVHGKNTHFFHNGILVKPGRIKNFKRRKTVKDSDSASPSAGTPPYITYCTPESESSPGPENIQGTGKEICHNNVAEDEDFQLIPSASTPSTQIGESFEAEGSTTSHSGDCVSPVSMSRSPPQSNSSVTSATIGDGQGKEAPNKAPYPPQSNINTSIRIKNLQRVYSPLLFQRPNETLHPTQQPDGRAIMLTQTKADFYVRRHDYDEAAVLYWRVIAGWRFLGDEEKRLGAQLALGSVLEKQNRMSDAFSLFMSTFIEHLDISLSLTHESPQFLSFRNSLLRLRRAQMRANIDGKWSEVVDRLSSLEEAEAGSLLSHHDYLGSAPGFIHGPDVVKHAISLAIAYSTIGEFGIAESIFQLVLNSTSEASRRRFNTLTLEDRAITNRDYAMHCHQRGNNLDCFSYLARALENCLEVHFSGIGTEFTNTVKQLLKIMNRQLVIDQESAANLAEVKLQQVSVVISIISRTVLYGESRKHPTSSS